MSSPVSSGSQPHSTFPSYGGGSPGSAGPAGPPGASSSAAAARQAAMALAEYYNQRASWIFSTAMASLIVLFTLFHWARFMYSRHGSEGFRDSTLMRYQVKIARISRSILLRQVPGFTSLGHAILVIVYLAINAALTVTFIDWSSLIGIGKRCGWMALTNIAFITFLALKNTPLAFLTAYSHERLNKMHQVGGYTTVTYVFIHLTLLARGYVKSNRASIIFGDAQINGIIAASAMLVTLIAAVAIRRLRYEAFYVIHVLMYILIIINVGLHRPKIAEKALIITIIAGSMWTCDRIFRGCRIMWYSFGNRATITPLPHGGTRVVLDRSPLGAVPGNHIFLWIPSIRLVETHPFTIISSSTSPLELVVAAYDGFTNDLYEYAKKHPGASLRASADGPYGTTPNLAKSADKVILIAGGSGATYTFGVALEMLKNLGDSTKTTIEFIWAVKEHDGISWFSNELAELRSSPLVHLHLYTTRPSDFVRGEDTPPSTVIDDDEKPRNLDLDIEEHLSILTEPTASILESKPWESTTSLSVLHGRPNVEKLVKEIVANAKESNRIAIAACGPDGLMSDVRRVAAESIKVNGPSVELYCEQFGW